jgi:hypothetical protein
MILFYNLEKEAIKFFYVFCDVPNKKGLALNGNLIQ